MKTRHSLVSNSSSASFIVAYKPGEKCKCCGRGPDNLSELIERRDRFGENSVYATGVSEVLKEVSGTWADERPDLIEAIKMTPKDMEVIYFSISMHDMDTIEMIEGIEKSGTGKILYRGEG